MSAFSLRLSLKFLVVYSLTLTLAIPPTVMLGTPSLSSIPSARADAGPNWPWIPAGPASDTLSETIFTDESAEFNALMGGAVDFMDGPLTPSQSSQLLTNPNFYVTSPVTDSDYYSLEFNLANGYWGCQMNFGNSACGIDIRQGISHLIDASNFVASEPGIVGGNAVPVDNPVPPGVDLNTPDPCAWDATHIQSGPGCQVNGVSGTAYHLAAATAGNCTSTPSFSWAPGCGTPDFCAAADHMISAGLASGKDLTTCVLTGVNTAAVTANPVQIFARSDTPEMLHLGNGVAQEICGLFTGVFTTGCGVSPSTTNILTVLPGPITAFPGFTTSTTAVANSWWISTTDHVAMGTFDSSLYYMLNSQFVSGVPSIIQPTGPCSAGARPTSSAPNYGYLCRGDFDTASKQAEFAPCLTAPGDPQTGQTAATVTFANCPGTSQPSAATATYQAQDIHGKTATTKPVWSRIKEVWGYAKKLKDFVNGVQNLIKLVKQLGQAAQKFGTLLNAFDSTGLSNLIREGLLMGTELNPYIAGTVFSWDILAAIYDFPEIFDYQQQGQLAGLMDWLTVSDQFIPNNQLAYAPPAGTTITLRLVIRSDVFFHDGRKMTPLDWAFSALSDMATGAFNAAGLSDVAGVTIVSATQIDFNLKALGPYTKAFLKLIAILSGHYWVSVGPTAWDQSEAQWQTQCGRTFGCFGSYVLDSSGNVVCNGSCTFPASNLNVDPTKAAPGFDPLAAGILIGSGPFVCESSSTGVRGGGCSSSGTQNPGLGGTFTLTRFGVGHAPGTSLSDTYFRSSGNLALWSWSGDRGTFSNDFLNFGAAALCFGKPVGTTGCTVWQHGIGGSPTGTIVGLSQISIIQRFVGMNWVSPFDWITSPPQNIATFPPVLQEGSITLNPCSLDPVNGYDC